MLNEDRPLDSLPAAPDIPVTPDPFKNKPAHVGSGLRALAAAVAVAVIFAAVVVAFLVLTSEPTVILEPVKPSPSASGPTHVVAPSDAVVQEELEQELALFQKQGGAAANARLGSYRAGLMSAGCRVGLGHGTNFSSERAAKAAAISYLTSAEVATTKDGSTFGAGAVVATKEDGSVDYFVIFVLCPPVAS